MGQNRILDLSRGQTMKSVCVSNQHSCMKKQIKLHRWNCFSRSFLFHFIVHVFSSYCGIEPQATNNTMSQVFVMCFYCTFLRTYSVYLTQQFVQNWTDETFIALVRSAVILWDLWISSTSDRAESGFNRRLVIKLGSDLDSVLIKHSNQCLWMKIQIKQK